MSIEREVSNIFYKHSEKRTLKSIFLYAIILMKIYYY